MLKDTLTGSLSATGHTDSKIIKEPPTDQSDCLIHSLSYQIDTLLRAEI